MHFKSSSRLWTLKYSASWFLNLRTLTSICWRSLTTWLDLVGGDTWRARLKFVGMTLGHSLNSCCTPNPRDSFCNGRCSKHNSLLCFASKSRVIHATGICLDSKYPKIVEWAVNWDKCYLTQFFFSPRSKRIIVSTFKYIFCCTCAAMEKQEFCIYPQSSTALSNEFVQTAKLNAFVSSNGK